MRCERTQKNRPRRETCRAAKRARNTKACIVTACGACFTSEELVVSAERKTKKIRKNGPFRKLVERIYTKSNSFIDSRATSGMSENVNKAIEVAKEFNAKSFALLGNNGGKTKELADEVLVVPSNDTAVIQEIHLMVLHIICELI